MVSTALSSFALSIALALQSAPQTPQAVAPSQLEDVVVEGRTLRDAVNSFVDGIVAPPVGRGPARWNRRVCVGVVNLRRDAAQALADQVSSVASRVGLEIGEPGCNPNILIVATDDGRELAHALVVEKPLAFRPQYSGAARSSEALALFQATPAAVRWWHVSMPVVRATGEPGVRMPGGGAPMIPGEGRLRSPLRNDLQRVFVIVDMDDAAGRSVQQLGDYIGMVALAQVDPQAQTAAYDTVLNLFTSAAPGLTLTDWDVSFLTALYGSELNQRNGNAQAGEVASIMLRDQTAASDESNPEAAQGD